MLMNKRHVVDVLPWFWYIIGRVGVLDFNGYNTTLLFRYTVGCNLPEIEVGPRSVIVQ